MKRASADTQALVYAYGCGQPISGLEHALAERGLQRAMWDALVRSDRAAEQAQEDAARADPEIGALLADIDRLNAAIDEAVTARRAARARVRTKVETPELDAQIGALSEERRAARKRLWPLLSAWRKAHKDDLTDIEQVRRDQAKAIRQSSGLYWCNYNRVIDSFERARKLARTRGGRPRYSDPTRTDGVLTVQIQRTASGLGASIADLMGGRFSALMIAPVDPAAFDPVTPRGERRRLARTTVDLRVDVAGHRLVIPVAIHRLPPPGARIKSAQLTWKQEGERIRWQLALTCVQPAETVVNRSPRAIGLDLGWRLEPDRGLLVATGWDGREVHRYYLPADWMAGMDQVERLASHIDEGLLELAREWHERVDELPDDLRAPLMRWRPKLGARHVDAAALHEAVRARIAASRASGVRADLPPSIRAWYERYRHLGIWRDNLRAKLGRRRRELYRLIARELATRYALIGVEQLDLSELARTRQRDPETGDNPLHAAARANRVRAALHSLRQEIAHQAAKHGCEVATVTGPTTVQCRRGHATGQKDPTRRVWVCEQCGSVWDQDLNAAQNIYAAAVGEAHGEIRRVA